MLVWMLYVIVVSAFLGAAALAAEYAGRLRRGSTRWLWSLSMVASLLVPAIIVSVSVQLPSIPNIVSPVASQRIVSLRNATSKSLSPANWMSGDARRISARPSVDALLRRGWGVASSVLLLGLLASGVHLGLRKRRWKLGTLAGATVYITDNVGPAVVGLLRPRIAVPSWLCGAPAVTQQLVIAHEKAHLEAHDVRLLTAGVLLLVGMPWNLPMWWQLRRLRYAIEVDCDARILSTGRDATTYGETLIAVGERQSGFVGAVAGMSESKSFLEERIKLMVRKPVRTWQASMAALVGLSLALVAVASQVEPPNAGMVVSGEHHEILVDTATLDRYTGFYRISSTDFFTITREGGHLMAQMPEQPAYPIYPETTAKFFYIMEVTDTQIEFETNAQGEVTAMVVHDRGVDSRCRRIDAAKAQQIATNLAARVASQKPMPGSDATVNRIITGIASGKPNYEEMYRPFADTMRKQLPETQAVLAKFGAVLSIEFLGLGDQGWQTYLIRQEHGVSQLRVNFNELGIICGVQLTTGP
jgi:bla regulator protein BlaR1